MTNLFKDTWTYQTMQKMAQEEAKQEARKEVEEAHKEFQRRLKEAEKARKLAQKQADEARRQTLEQAIVALISERFPKLVRSAKKLIKSTESADHLQQLLIHLSLVQDEMEAEHALLHFGDDEMSVPMQEEVG